MKSKYIIFFALFFACFGTKINARPRPSFHLSPHISNLQIRDICKDSLGYLWIATARGLNRYNGYEYMQLLRDESTPQSTIPSNRINRIGLDRQNDIWIATSRGLSKYDREFDSITTYKVSGQQEEYYVTDFKEDSAGGLWVATYRHGLLYLAPGADRLSRVDQALGQNTPQTIQALALDDEQNLWIGYANSSALGRYNIRDRMSEIFHLPDYIEINCLAAPGKSGIWIGTDQGILAYDPEARKMTPLPASVRERPGLSDARIHSISLINNKYYIITSTGGAYKYNLKTEEIARLPVETGENNETNDITCSVEDAQGNLWFGLYGQGIFELKKTDTPFNRKGNELFPLKGKLISAAAEDWKFGRLWFGSPYSGLYVYGKDGAVRNLTHENHPALSALGSNFIRLLFCDSAGRIWISVGRHLLVGRLDAGGFSEIATLRNFGRIQTITEDPDHNVWTGGPSGLFCFKANTTSPVPVVENSHIASVAPYGKSGVVYAVYEQDIYTVDNRNFQSRKLLPEEITNLHPINACMVIYPSEKGELWFGSYTKGVLRYDPRTTKITRYTQQDGLPSNDVLAIAEDRSGKLWLATSNGLSRFDPATERFCNFDGTDGLQNTQFSEKAMLQASSGRLYIGGNTGVDSFDPDDIQQSGHCPSVVLEDLKILNKSVVAAPKGSPIDRNIAFAQKIALTHRQNSFSIDYAGIDYNASGKLRYSYRLDGFDKEWVEAGSNKRASYSNLGPGNYRFRLRVQNGDGEWSPEIGIDVRIKASPWQTWWAYLLYIGGALGMTVLVSRLYFNTKYNKKSLLLSEQQRIREQGITRQKIDFYTNISHELRTPLTLISGNIDLLLREHKPSPEEKKLIATISYNTARLLRLIDQLLDFSKIENDTLALQVAHTDIVPILNNVADSFRINARSKAIEYTVIPAAEKIEAYADEDMLEKVLTNLISNAVKYTPYNGKITIRAGFARASAVGVKYGAAQVGDSRYIEFSVSNTCEPLEPAELERMFDRYARLDHNAKDGPGNGTGIGLHYTKTLITRHKGFIRAISTETDGLTMSFAIPADAQAFAKEEIYDGGQYRYERPMPMPEPEDDAAGIVSLPVTEQVPKAHTLLIVEDDPQIHSLLHEILHDEYNLLHAYDGTEGLRLVREHMPDMVLSDVRMPETDGFDLCRIIKNDPQLSHIIVILLTAKTRIEEHIEGYSYGADAYVNKPFRVAHLQSIVRSHIRSLDRLKAYLNGKNPAQAKGESEISGYGETADALSEIDQRFLEKLHSFIDKSIENPDININVIAVELGFSRTSFYRKMKSLTGVAPNDYVRNFKMKKAAQLIIEGNMSIAEISDQTGFGTQSHFSTAFKKYFGVSPKDYKEKGRRGETKTRHTGNNRTND